MERKPRTTGGRVDAVNVAVTCGESTDGHGSAGCLAELAIRHYPKEADATRLRIARNYGLPKRAFSMVDIALRVPGFNPATRDGLSCAVGSEWFEDLGAAPERAIPDTIFRTIVEAVGTAIWKPTAPARLRR